MKKLTKSRGVKITGKTIGVIKIWASFFEVRFDFWRGVTFDTNEEEIVVLH